MIYELDTRDKQERFARESINTLFANNIFPKDFNIKRREFFEELAESLSFDSVDDMYDFYASKNVLSSNEIS